MNKKAVIVVGIVIVVGGVAVVLGGKQSNTETNSVPSNYSADQSKQSSEKPNTSNTNAPTTASDFVVKATDNSADPTTLNVRKGDTVKVTFSVQQEGVYHGGLEFKSDVISSGPIKPGESQTVSFVADRSFDFTPYWYQSQVKKDYLVSVKVQ